MAYFDNITLEKGMYGSNGQGFTEALERLDPSGGYAGTELAGLDAYERQLKRFDIKVKGAGSDVVEKFFATSQSAALFPEYVRRCVLQGMNSVVGLNEITAAVTRVDAPDYRPLASALAESDKTYPVTAAGTALPATEIKLRNELIPLKKRGRLLVTSYEALRFQRLELFAVTLRQIGACIARAQLGDAIDVLIGGDDAEGTNAADVMKVATAGSLTYTDLISLWGAFSEFEMNRLIASPDMMAKLLAIEELQNPATGLNFQGTGMLSTPLGATLFRSSAVPTGDLLAIDKNCAMEMVVAADTAIDFDRLIDRQMERASVYSVTGFAKIFADAAKILEV